MTRWGFLLMVFVVCLALSQNVEGATDVQVYPYQSNNAQRCYNPPGCAGIDNVQYDQPFFGNLSDDWYYVSVVFNLTNVTGTITSANFSIKTFSHSGATFDFELFAANATAACDINYDSDYSGFLAAMYNESIVGTKGSGNYVYAPDTWYDFEVTGPLQLRKDTWSEECVILGFKAFNYSNETGGYSRWTDDDDTIADRSYINITFGAAADNSPTTTLVSPTDTGLDNDGSVFLNCTATDDNNLVNISTYMNVSGTWSANYTNSTTNTWNFSSNTVSFASGTTVLWNCLATDNASQTDWGNSNRTFHIDSTIPDIEFVSPTPDNLTLENTTNSVTINASISETPSACVLDWNGTNVTMTIDGTFCSNTRSGLTNGTFTYFVFANDSAGNNNVSESRDVNISYSSVDTSWISNQTNYYNISIDNGNTYAIIWKALNTLAGWMTNTLINFHLDTYNSTKPYHYVEDYIYNETGLSDGILHSGAGITSEIIYNNSDIAIFKAYDESGDIHGGWMYLFQKTKDYVVKKEWDSVHTTGWQSNNQEPSMWNQSHFHAKGNINYSDESGNTRNAGSEDNFVSCFGHLNSGTQDSDTAFFWISGYNSTHNITTGYALTGTDHWQHHMVGKYSIAVSVGVQTEPQLNIFGQPDNGQFYFDLFGEKQWTEEMMYAGVQSVDYVADKSKEWFNHNYFENKTAYNAFWSEIATGSTTNEIKSGNNWIYSYTGWAWYMPLFGSYKKAGGTTYSSGRTLTENFEINVSGTITDIHTDTTGSTLIDNSRGRSSYDRWAWGKWNVSNNNYTIEINQTAYNDSDKIVRTINFTTNVDVNITDLYLEFLAQNWDDGSDVDGGDILEINWVDPNHGDYGLALVNVSGFVAGATETSGVSKYMRFFLVNNSGDVEYSADTSWEGTMWLFPHKDNVTHQNNVTSLHSRDTTHMTYRLYYRTLAGLQTNASFGIKPSWDVFDFNATSNGTFLTFYTWADAGAHNMTLYVNISDSLNVTRVRQDGSSMNTSNWSFNNGTKILTLNATWSSISLFEVDYSNVSGGAASDAPGGPTGSPGGSTDPPPPSPDCEFSMTPTGTVVAKSLDGTKTEMLKIQVKNLVEKQSFSIMVSGEIGEMCEIMALPEYPIEYLGFGDFVIQCMMPENATTGTVEIMAERGCSQKLTLTLDPDITVLEKAVMLLRLAATGFWDFLVYDAVLPVWLWIAIFTGFSYLLYRW